MNKRLVIVALLFISLVIIRIAVRGQYEGFQEEKKIVIAKADWCGHCRKAAPEFEKLRLASPLRLANGNQVTVEVLDADQNKAEVTALGVKGFPTIMMMKGGEKVEYPGERTYDAVVEFLNQNA